MARLEAVQLVPWGIGKSTSLLAELAFGYGADVELAKVGLGVCLVHVVGARRMRHPQEADGYPDVAAKTVSNTRSHLLQNHASHPQLAGLESHRDP